MFYCLLLVCCNINTYVQQRVYLGGKRRHSSFTNARNSHNPSFVLALTSRPKSMARCKYM